MVFQKWNKLIFRDSQSNEAVATEPETATEEDEKPEEEIDIDLNDPNVDAAATKIQAGFRGHKARKEIKEQKVKLYVFTQCFQEKL